MKLRLEGHDCRFAVEQIMLALFPNERPDYDYVTDGRIGMSALSRLNTGGVRYAQATTVLRRGGESKRGVARVCKEKLTDKLTTDRLIQQIIKQSFYRAAAGFLEAAPVWGSLTGIRPVKLAAAALETGADKKSAAKALISKYYVSPERAEMCTDAAQISLEVKRSLNMGDVALYIGVPFCPTRCAYCSFVSNSVEKSFGLIEPFADTLISEIRALAETVRELDLRVIAIYIGGGTPTALPAEILEKAMLAVAESFDLSLVREYTVEAGRPDTVTRRKLEIVERLGADRICINPQSMSAEVLSAIGRGHTPEDVLSAAELVRRGGAALNMDIIAGLPGDTPDGFSATLDTLMGLRPENITVHTLSLKKGSRVMEGGMAVPGGEDVAGMLGYASRRLRDGGYGPYYLYRQKFISGGFENTGWTLAGYEGIYNICMMEEHCTVLALGGGGVTKLVSPGGRIERIFNAKYPREYIMHTDKIADKIKRIKDFYSLGG